MTKPSIPPGSSRSQILTLAWPVILNNLLLTFVWIVDMMMVGRLGPQAVAAVGVSGQMFNMVMVISLAVSNGTIALVARYIGAEEPEQANTVLGQSLVLGTILSIPLMLPGILAAENLFEFFGAEAEVVDVGVPYLRLVLLGTPLIVAALVVSSALRGAGDTKTPLVISVAANVINLILNYALIFGKFGLPRLEVFGAGIATLIAFFIEAVAFVLVVWKGDLVLSLPRKLFRLEKDIVRKILRIGSPTALESGCIQGGMLWYMSIISLYGTDPLAAYLIGVSIMSLSFMPGFGFSVAASTLVGQSLGAKEPEKAAAYGWEAMRLGAIVMFLIGVVLFVAAQPIGLIYVDEESVIAYIVIFVRILAMCQLGMAVTFTLTGALIGAADTRWPLYASFVGMFLIRIPLAIVAAYVLGVSITCGVSITWVWMITLADHYGRAAILFHRFLSGKWKKTEV
jgi:putative MATE family efflux protein